MADKGVFLGTGRRKKSIARVRLMPGNGKITVNGVDVTEYFTQETLRVILSQPLEAVNALTKFDIIAKVQGGGFSGQAGALRLGIARALVEADEENKSSLRTLGYLTRDSRVKERKKYGLKKARKAPQFSKR
ncbi:MAG: 30S ribosomal protein S9 [Clostridiales bacterium]|nr:30S ribosomal protein S9 [Clostridiales bacterium]